MVTVCVSVLLLPHGSASDQVRVMTRGQLPFVTKVLETETLPPLQLSKTGNGSNAQAEPQSTVLFVRPESQSGITDTSSK